jgi:hypothetical protein
MILETEQKDQLYTALSQAQVEFPTIRVNRKAFKNEFADLYAILKPVYPILSKYGLSIRPWGGIVDGMQCIGARLMHKSGQYETNVFLFDQDPCKNPNDQLTHKKQGALTYFNRNHMKDMLGVLISDNPEDDDGQGYHEKQPQVVEITPQKQPSFDKPRQEIQANISFKPASDAQIKMINDIAVKNGSFLSEVLEKHGFRDISEVSSSQASKIISGK